MICKQEIINDKSCEHYFRPTFKDALDNQLQNPIFVTERAHPECSDTKVTHAMRKAISLGILKNGDKS